MTFCLAAALRYQLARDGAHLPEYALVILDEAFDKTDPEFTRAGLEVFRAFGGFGMTQLAQIGWLASAGRLLYWGDLDTYGFEILARCRAALPQVQSVLMDRSTLARFADRAVAEPRPYRAEVGRLTPDEAITLATLRETNGRLEQERLDRAYVSEMLTVTLAAKGRG